MPDLKQSEAKTSVPGQAMPGAAGLMASPFTGAAMMSALGFGFAGQAFGFWMGSMSGMAEASRRMFALPGDEAAAKRSASTKAKTAAKVLIEETQSAALEIAGDIAPVAVASEASVELQPEDFRKPKAMAKPRKADDLKAISGIGPKLEKVLNGLGVWTYAQIAAWTGEEVAWVDDYLAFNGRIDRDGWIAQASALAVDKNRAGRAS